MTELTRFAERLHIPPEGLPVAETLFSPEEIRFVNALTSDRFGLAEAAAVLRQSTGREPTPEQTDEYLRAEYRRGLLALEDESFTRYRLCPFETRLDIFVTTQTERYRAFPPQVREALDAWYFQKYLAGLANAPRPTGDRILPLEEALDYVDAQERPIWFQNCDCRALSGGCGKPVNTCITFRSGINTMAHRGLAKRVTKEEAKDVIRRANKAGLMQTCNENGMCNCCGDCCYLFRTQKARPYGLAWPASGEIASLDPQKCIACRRCVKRCNFGAFVFEGGAIRFDPEECRGCALCAQTCPAGAITMERRTPHE